MNLINAKVYYDGSHWIAIPHTERPFRRRRRRAAENVDNSEKVIQFEQAFKSVPKGKKTTKKEKLLKEFKPLFKTESEAAEFVEEQYERLTRNRIERNRRMNAKPICNLGTTSALLPIRTKNTRKIVSERL